MIIPIQREGAISPSHHQFNTYSQPSTSKTSSSTYTSKKFVQITPKITDVEILPRQKFQPESTTNIPVSILSTSKSNKSKFNKQWDDLPALKRFETTSNNWIRDNNNDIMDNSFRDFSSRSLLKEKFDDFTTQHALVAPTSMFKKDLHHHPIQIETFVAENDRYVLTMNVQQFKPDELQVKITDDTISVTGKHEEKKDEGNFSFQEYARKHTLPPGVKADDVKCALSLSGILTISAPRKQDTQPALQQWERTIPIQHSSAIRV